MSETVPEQKKIIVYFLDSGRMKTYNSMKHLLRCIPCLTERRVLHCIETGEKWRTMAFDEVEDK